MFPTMFSNKNPASSSFLIKSLCFISVPPHINSIHTNYTTINMFTYKIWSKADREKTNLFYYGVHFMQIMWIRIELTNPMLAIPMDVAM